MQYPLIIALLTLPAWLRAVELPPEIAEARKRYEAAVAVAVKPVRDHYLQDLQQMKSRAMALSKLDLALAIDAEIKTVSQADAIAELEKRLIGTTWTWDNRAKFNFLKNGQATMRDDQMKWTVTGPVMVEYAFGNGNHGTIDFEASLRRGTIHEIRGDGTKADMPLIRNKE
jgi:hypothetical protein